MTKSADDAFRGCSNLTAINFPNLTSLGAYSFYGCSNLTAINLPAATSAGGYAFAECRSLTTVNLPALTSIGAAVFDGCKKLTTLDAPAATSISSVAFRDCSNLTTVILRSKTLCTLPYNTAFTATAIASGTGYIYVPKALVDSYKAASNWSAYADQIRAIEDYPEITGGEPA